MIQLLIYEFVLLGFLLVIVRSLQSSAPQGTQTAVLEENQHTTINYAKYKLWQLTVLSSSHYNPAVRVYDVLLYIIHSCWSTRRGKVNLGWLLSGTLCTCC